MKSLIVKRVNKIFEFGCKSGKTTYDLIKLGYDVIGRSFDKNPMEAASAKYSKNIFRDGKKTISYLKTARCVTRYFFSNKEV